MKQERVLSLDISTKTGWALLISGPKDYRLEAYGKVEQVKCPEDVPYPISFVNWAYTCYQYIVDLIDQYYPDVLVIEETASGSKSSHSQKILEFIHFLVAKLIKETGIKAIYFMTGEWRNETGCKMNKAEKMHNKEVRKYKKIHNVNMAYDKNGKRIGIIGRKHVNIRRANEVFGSFLKTPLKKKDEDTADSLMLAYCYHVRKLRGMYG